MSARRSHLVAATVLVAAALAAYANSFTPRFAGPDAKESIRDNPHIRQLWPLGEAMSLPLLDATLRDDPDSKGGTVVRRPVLSLSFALNRSLLGPRPQGFHAVNLVIHIGAALVLFGLVRRTLALPCFVSGRFAGEAAGHASVIALVVALLWVVHPLQTESVTYLVQRAESLMGLLYLATLYAALRGFTSDHPGRWYLAATVSCALGMGTKETMVTAPLVVLLYDRTFVSASFAAGLRRHAPLYAGLAAGWSVIAVLVAITAADVASDFAGGNMLSYAMAQPGVIAHYLRLALWPHPLFVYVSTSAFDVTSPTQLVLPALLLLALLAGSAWALARRHWLGFAGAWLFVILAPTSSVVAISDVIQEHRMYLPLAAVIVTAVAAAVAALGAAGRAGMSGRGRAATAVTLVMGVTLTFAALTHARNRDYHSEFGMVHPADLHEQYMILAQHYLHQDDLSAIRAESEQALALGGDPRDVTFAHFILGFADEREDRLDAAERHFNAAVELDPRFAYGHKELAAVLRRRGDLERAAAHCERAIELRPLFPEAHSELGMVAAELGRTAEARAHFDAALAMWPGFVDAHFELALVLLQLGEPDGARRHLERVIELDPDYEDAARRLAELGDPDRRGGRAE